MEPTDITIEILKGIRDEVKQTNSRLDAMREELSGRIDSTNTRIDSTNARLDRCKTGSPGASSSPKCGRDRHLRPQLHDARDDGRSPRPARSAPPRRPLRARHHAQAAPRARLVSRPRPRRGNGRPASEAARGAGRARLIAEARQGWLRARAGLIAGPIRADCEASKADCEGGRAAREASKAARGAST